MHRVQFHQYMYLPAQIGRLCDYIKDLAINPGAYAYHYRQSIVTVLVSYKVWPEPGPSKLCQNSAELHRVFGSDGFAFSGHTKQSVRPPIGIGASPNAKLPLTHQVGLHIPTRRPLPRVRTVRWLHEGCCSRICIVHHGISAAAPSPSNAQNA